jgi:quercetin dioxygenase-like cupin family protein
MPEPQQAATATPNALQKPKIVVQTADVRVVEYTLQPGDRHPWHYHSEVSDRVYCLEGLVGIDTQTPPEKVVLKPGESCETPAKTVHHVSNAGPGVSRYLLVQALGKYDYVKTSA